MVGISVQHGVTRKINALLLQDAVDFPPEQEANPSPMCAGESVYGCVCVYLSCMKYCMLRSLMSSGFLSLA